MTIDIEGFGKVTASKEVLNRMVQLFYADANLCDLQMDRTDDQKLKDAYRRKAENSREYAGIVFDALDSVGLYDDVK